MQKSKPILNLYNKKMSINFILGISMIVLFSLIYVISASIGSSPSYTSNLRNNILPNIGLTILTAFHAGTLGLGILFMLIASYNISPRIKCYDDRFEIHHLFHSTNVIKYEQITDVETKTVYVKNTNLFKKNEKEVQIEFKNPVYSFIFSYKTFGYFDDIKINGANNNAQSRKVFIKKDDLDKIVLQINKINKLKMPFLPDEIRH